MKIEELPTSKALADVKLSFRDPRIDEVADRLVDLDKATSIVLTLNEINDTVLLAKRLGGFCRRHYPQLRVRINSKIKKIIIADRKVFEQQKSTKQKK